MKSVTNNKLKEITTYVYYINKGHMEITGKGMFLYSNSLQISAIN